MKKLSHFQKQLLFSYFGDKHNINLSKDDFKHIDDVICSQNSGNAIVSGALPPVEQNLLDEAIADVITISKLNHYSVAKKLIREQFVVIDKQDLNGNER